MLISHVERDRERERERKRERERVTFLFCHVTPRENKIKGTSNLVKWSMST